MTASNLIVQANAAHLIADAAFYDEDDILREVRSKIAHAAAFRMALAVGGMVFAYELVEGLDTAEGHDQAFAMRAMSDAARSRRQKNREGNRGGEAPGNNELHVYLVMWSDSTDRPEGWALSSVPDWFGEGYQPFAWLPVDQIQTPTPIVPADRARFRPHRDGRKILEGQRSQMVLGQLVGGFGEVATVTRGGVTLDRLQTWPDVLGRRINA